MPFLVIGILLATAAIAAYTIRLLRMEKASANMPPEEDPDADPQSAQEGLDFPGDTGEDAPSLVELMGLKPDNENPDEKKPDEKKPANTGFVHKLHETAVYDTLCDLRVGLSYISECKRAMEESNIAWAVACIDLDRFRYINSLKGMQIGDMVLISLAAQLRLIFPEGSLITRTVADHFSVCFPLNDPSMLEHFAEEIKQACEKIRNDIGSKGVIRACMGVCVSDNSISVAQLSRCPHCIRFLA